MATSDQSSDERLEEVQETVDEMRGRVPDEPGVEIADQVARPHYAAESEDDEVRSGAGQGAEVDGTPGPPA